MTARSGPSPRYSADRIGLPYRPTAQQTAVIEAPLEPALVVAGAGSGKTETMAARVLWLLANDRVAPGEVLGLTFTRKAAGELARRVTSAIGRLEAAGLLPTPYDPFDPPVISTYNAFANTLYRDNAALLGRESDGTVLGEGAAWQLARSVVVESDDPRLAELDRSVEAVTDAVLALSHELAENVVDADDVRRLARDFSAIRDWEPGGRGSYATVTEMARAVGSLDVLVELSIAYRQRKRALGVVEYSDQVALALEILERSERVRDELRHRHRVVLLDEYQDTSVVQSRLLSVLFRDTAVMAVGDPFQAIYGWRGASAANLEGFARDFSSAHTTASFALSTSWRNGTGILEAANALVAPARAEADRHAETGLRVEPLRAADGAGTEPVDVVYEETVVEEAAAVAEWFAERLDVAEGAPPPSCALLLRARSSQQEFLSALAARGIPYHVLGVGGLLTEPEVADLVCALSVIDDPGAGIELVRLLAGARWRIGTRDLAALARLAHRLHRRERRVFDDEEAAALLRDSLSAEEGESLVDALDRLAHPEGQAVPVDGFSEVGLERLREAGRFFRALRRDAPSELLDLIDHVEHRLGLDIEVAANEARSRGTAARDALIDAAAGYLALGDSGDLRGFLRWLREAERRENLGPLDTEAEPGTVQVLTIHAAKGLEWDHVAVPRFVTDELPAKPRSSRGWLAFGALPYEFRGDAAQLPVLHWRAQTTRKDVGVAIKRYTGEVEVHAAKEERRLAYVAVTRARHRLLLSGSFWASQRRPRTPSPLLTELADAGVIGALPESPRAEENPLEAISDVISWPADPLGGRRAAVEEAARLIDQAPADGDAGDWSEEIALLLAERTELRRAVTAPPWPSRVPASRFHEYLTGTEAVAEALRRPMPAAPRRASRLGTLFHARVERHYGVAGSRERLDSLELELDDAEGPSGPASEEEARELDALMKRFSRSHWAARRPLEVEREIQFPFAGRTLVCKIDAVFAEGDRYRIVDWKTGRAPRDQDELDERALQLALYRVAYSRWAGVPLESVDAEFYYVAEGRRVQPRQFPDEEELLERWRGAFG